MTSLPAPGAAEQLTSFLQQHPWWSAFWDKRCGVWRIAEDDPDSALYAESADAAEVLSVPTARQAPRAAVARRGLGSVIRGSSSASSALATGAVLGTRRLEKQVDRPAISIPRPLSLCL
jgi:hypothetical protein